MNTGQAMPERPWIDEALSRELTVLRSRGEGQSLEFKQEFPRNAQDLGAEIAAFASSGGGTILLGVTDAGDLIGLSGLDHSHGRDQLARRIEGICSNQVKPAITPTLSFLIEDDKIVVAIVVPPGTQPVYFCGSIPYVRHLTSKRHAEPHEVIELVRRWLEIQPAATQSDSERSRFVSSLAITLADLLITSPEIEQRSINPWLDTVRAQFHSAAVMLRELSAEDLATELGIQTDLVQLADACQEVTDFRLYLGPESWAGFKEALDTATNQAQLLFTRAVESPGLTRDNARSAHKSFIVTLRRLDNLVARIDSMVEQGAFEELQNEASQIGGQILRLTLLGLNHVAGIDITHLRQAATQLHLTETHRLYLDGGASVVSLTDHIRGSATEIKRLAGEIPT